jgi:leader peptidase (prepilin peptidase)/N-methyltransferase
MVMAHLAAIASSAGAVLGSFLNVCIHRLPSGQSIVWPPSSCTSCGTRLKAGDLVPVLSYLVLRGRCRYCGVHISIQYPIVELATGILYAAIACVHGPSLAALHCIVLGSLLIVAAGTDINTGLIPDRVTLPGIVIGFILSFFSPEVTPAQSAMGILICGGLLYLLAVASRGGMGGGDIKLMAMMGAFLGWAQGLLALFIGALLGSVVGIAGIATGRLKRGQPMPFGPYLAAGGVISIFVGRFLLSLLGF